MTVTMTASLVLQWLQVVRGQFLDEWNRLGVLFVFTKQCSILTFMIHKWLLDTSYPVKWPKITRNGCSLQKMTVTTTRYNIKWPKWLSQWPKSHQTHTHSWRKGARGDLDIKQHPGGAVHEGPRAPRLCTACTPCSPLWRQSQRNRRSSCRLWRQEYE